MQWIFNKISDDPCRETLRRNIRVDPARIKILKYSPTRSCFCGYIYNHDNRRPIVILKSRKFMKLIKQEYVQLHESWPYDSGDIWIRKDSIIKTEGSQIWTSDEMFPVLYAGLNFNRQEIGKNGKTE